MLTSLEADSKWDDVAAIGGKQIIPMTSLLDC